MKWYTNLLDRCYEVCHTVLMPRQEDAMRSATKLPTQLTTWQGNGKSLRAWRLAQGLSLEALARQMEVSYWSVFRWEHEVGAPNRWALRRLQQAGYRIIEPSR